MTRQDRPFVRVYHDDLQANYPAIWDDDALLAAWLRLLVVADKMWPAPAELPRRERPRSIARLVATGILKLLPRQRFNLNGLDAERQRRVDAAKVAAGARWSNGRADGGTGGNADGNATRIPPRNPTGNPSHGQGGASALRPPQSESESESDTDENAVLTWLASVGATVQPNGNGYHQELVKFVGRQGATAVISAMEARYAAGDRSARQLLYGAMNDIERIHRPGTEKGPAIAGDVEARVDAFNR